MVGIPTGTVTFLFTDIEGSTRLAREHPEVWESLRARHHSILHEAIECYQGYVFQIIGDAFCAAFHTVRDGMNAALNAQRKLQSEDWGKTPVKVRMGLHTGAAEFRGSDYRGYLTMARVQRVMSTAYGGQILLSNASAELIRGELPEGIDLRDMGENRLKGLLNPEHLWQIVTTDLPHNFPPLTTLNGIPNNLPVQMTSFVGREKEIAGVVQELYRHRLVTLTGAGGTGKTRLSLQVAAEVLDQYPGGVWFVELASLTDSNLIPQSILVTIGIGEQPGKTPIEVLKEYLHEKVTLIVLDNCEHLIEGSATVTNALLYAAPKLRIIASSREVLGVHGEASYPVPSLSLPDPEHLSGLEQLSQYESVQLFIDRALLVQPHFAVTSQNAPAIAQICYRLDGIPLAIELAAARLKILSAEQIATRLDDRFRLLTSGSRTSLPRHQTLRATIDWSYDLLNENEKLLFRRIAVFEGGWSLELAEKICSDEKLKAWDILDLVSHLVDKSLVLAVEGKTGTRYHILETVRQYAREKLLATDEVKAIRDRHRDVYLEYAETIEPETIGAQRKKWLNVYETELNNFRAAFQWSLENKDAEQAIRLCTGLANFRGQNNHQYEAALTSKQALDLANETGTAIPAFWQAGILLAYVVFTRAVHGKAFSDPSFLPLLEQSHGLYMSVNNYAHSAPVLAATFLADAYMDLNDLISAEKCLLNTYERVNASKYQWGIAWLKQRMAVLSLRKGDVATWLVLLQDALEIVTELGDDWSVKNISEELVQQKYLRGEFEDAIRQINQNILLYERGNREESARIAFCYKILGSIALFQGQYEVSRRYLADAADIFGNFDTGFRVYSALTKEELTFVLYKEGSIEAAQDQYEALIAEYKDLSASFFYGVIHVRFALVCLSRGRRDQARKSLEIGSDILNKTATQPDIYLVPFGFGELARLENKASEALNHYCTSLQYANEFFDYKSFPEILDGIAKAECLRSNFEKATRLFGASEALRKKMGAVIHPVDRPGYDEQVWLLQEQINPDQLELAWLDGAGMGIDEIVSFARWDGN